MNLEASDFTLWANILLFYLFIPFLCLTLHDYPNFIMNGNRKIYRNNGWEILSLHYSILQKLIGNRMLLLFRIFTSWKQGKVSISSRIKNSFENRIDRSICSNRSSIDQPEPKSKNSTAGKKKKEIKMINLLPRDTTISNHIKITLNPTPIPC